MRSQTARVAWVSVLTATMILLVSGVMLLECPFFQAEASAHESCCPLPKGAGDQPQCPFAPNQETCPYFLADGKLNFAEVRIVAVVPGPIGLEPVLEAPAAVFQPLAPSREIDGRNLHIRLRVFRI